MNVSDDLIKQSVEVMINGRDGTIAQLICCCLAFLMGSMQMALMILWKPLRHIDQCLIFFIAASDALTSIVSTVTQIKWLYLVANGMPDIMSQRICMYWMFSVMSGYFIIDVLMLAISVDRMLSLAFPIWYSGSFVILSKGIVTSIAVKVSAIIFSIVVGLVFSGSLFIDSSTSNVQLACSAVTSPVPYVRASISYALNALCISVVLVNLISCGIVLTRWRRAKRSSAHDMVVFRSDVQLHAFKTLLIVIVLFIISIYGGTLYVMVLNSLPISTQNRLKYSQYAGALTELRGAFDVWIFVLMSQEYRNGFRFVLKKCGFRNKQQTISPVIPIR